MQYNTIEGVAKPVARLLQGTVMLSEATRSENRQLFDTLFERGFTAFDTAEFYGGGEVEREFGLWMKERGIRDELVILGKGAHPHEPEEPKRVTPDYIRADIETSLERMQTNFIDIYVLHRDDPDYPVGEIVDVLNEQKDAGRIGAFGGSNWTVERIQAANEYAAANSRTPFTITSPQFSLAEMIKEPWPACISVSGAAGEAARAWYAANGVSIFAWSSLAGGFMTGKFTRDNLDNFTAYFDVVSIQAYAYESNFQRLDRARQLASDKGVSPAQLSLAYVLHNSPQTYAIIANWEISQIDDNLKALDVTLSPQEIAWLEMKTEEKPS